MKGLLKLSLMSISFVLVIQSTTLFAQGTWTVAATPDLTTGISDQFFLPDGQTGWFVGDAGTILKTIDGGVTRSPQISGAT